MGDLGVGRGPNGSGDTTADYVQLFCWLVLAIAAAAIWSVADRKRPHYRRLYGALRVYVRYLLAFTMFAYGLVKVLPSQFSPPTATQRFERYGESTPMHLLWTFMGSSPAYTIFAGSCEVLGGALLLWRRTTLLGALILVGVIGNVFVLNLCDDVPVKLYSGQLLGCAIFLAAPDARRLILFFLERASAARRHRAWLIAKLDDAWDSYREYGAGRDHNPDGGFWEPDTADTYNLLVIGDWTWIASRPDGTRDIWGIERSGDTISSSSTAPSSR